MKTPLLVALLALSLAANAALYISRVPSSAARPSDSAPVAPTAASAAPASRPAAGAAASVDSPTVKAETAQLAKVWANLQSGDLKTLVERLRAAGFSPAMIRSIVGAQVNEQFSARRKELIAAQGEIPFWQPQRSFMDPKTMASLRELGREQSNLLKELLGPDGMPGSEEMLMYQRRQFGNLAPDKLEQLQRIASDYGELRSQIFSTANGMMLPEDREKITLLEKEQRADIAALLSPEEFENYELRSSNTANQLRSQLGTFKPTEAEFRAIFKATRAAEEQFGSLASGSINPNQYRQFQTAVLDSAKSLLTPERYGEFQQATDPAYQQINRLVARLDLPATVAPQVVNIQQDMQKRYAAIRSDRSLTPEQQSAQAAALQQEATTNLTNVLGQRGFEAYKQYGGQWMQNLSRPIPPANPNAPPRG